MSDEIEHPTAYYRDKQGVLHEIEAKFLNQPGVLETARLNFLTDADEQVQLFAKPSKVNQPHFCIKGQRGPRIFSGERSPVHDDRVTALASSLNSLSNKWKLCCRVKSGELATELELSEYSWGSEVARHLARGVAVRHDLYGASPLLSSSILRPSIAIEVIHTHYPEEQAFEAMLSLSERVPYIVYFEHTRRINKFIKVDSYRNQLIFDNFTYFIKDGRVWQGQSEQPTGILTSAGLRIAFEGLLDRWDAFTRERNP